MLKLIRGLHNIPDHFPSCVTSIGNFDGIHRGHQQLIQHLKEKSKSTHLPSLLITFEPQPNEYFSQQSIPPRLMRLREKLKIFQEQELDYLLCLRFDQKLADMPAEDFVEKILVDRLHVSYVLVGDDFQFGHKRQGNISLLQRLGKTYGFSAEEMPTFRWQGQRVSSSAVRKALQAGDIALAEELLGRDYGLSGRVAHGDKRGRILGFPTANVFLHRKAVPVHGIFAVKTHGLAPEPIYGVANVGNRPTVGGGRTLLEVHLFDFDQMIYGKRIYVEFVHKLRDEEYYPSLELLQQQIAIDVQQAKAYFANKFFI